jgi:hypothetical protein
VLARANPWPPLDKVAVASATVASTGTSTGSSAGSRGKAVKAVPDAVAS